MTIYTLFYALFAILFVCHIKESIMYLIFAIFMMCFLIPYIIIIYKMFHYGLRIKDTKSKLILYGVGLYFFTHLLVNVGGVSGFIPMTGVPLLLISSGGSSTLAAMMGLGIAQSLIARYNRDLLKEQME